MKLVLYILVNIALISGIVGIYYHFIPQIMAEKTTELERRQREYIEKLETANTVEEKFEEVAQVRRKYVLVSQAFPSTSSEVSNYLQIQGERCGVSIIKNEPVSSDSLDTPGTIAFNVSIRSRYHDFAVFLTNLADGEIPVQWSDVSLSRIDGTDGNTVACKMRITSFIEERP